MLYDAGRLLSPEESTRSIASVLWSKGVTHLDAVVLSHADSDHFNGLPGLLDRFSVGVVYVSPVMFDDPSAALAALAESIRRARVPLDRSSPAIISAAGPTARSRSSIRRGRAFPEVITPIALCWRSNT